jgi:hypothetical protein
MAGCARVLFDMMQAKENLKEDEIMMMMKMLDQRLI